jgi:hypothetical protein
MGDTKLNDDDDLVDYNEVDAEDHIAGKSQNAPNGGSGKRNAVDGTFNHDMEALSRSGDSSFYDPYVPRPPRGSVRIFNISSKQWAHV